MKLTVVNREIQIGEIKVVRAVTASLVLFGDTEAIAVSTAYDTPADSLIFGPQVPMNETGKEKARFRE